MKVNDIIKAYEAVKDLPPNQALAVDGLWALDGDSIEISRWDTHKTVLKIRGY